MVGLKEKVPALAKHLVNFESFDPANPDQPADFVWYPADFYEIVKPYGN